MGIGFSIFQPAFVSLDLVAPICLPISRVLMKSTRSAFELYRLLLPGVVNTYAVLKSFYYSEGKLPWTIGTLVSVSSMVVTMGLGSWLSSMIK